MDRTDYAAEYSVNKRGRMKPEELLAGAAIIGGFGTTVLMFRLQRELAMADQNQPTWVPVADLLMIAGTVVSFMVVAALLAFPAGASRLAAAALAGAAILAAGYPLAIFAHYRFLKLEGPPRRKIERAEGQVVLVCAVLALIAAVYTFTR